jgi:hypothetical protein
MKMVITDQMVSSSRRVPNKSSAACTRDREIEASASTGRTGPALTCHIVIDSGRWGTQTHGGSRAPQVKPGIAVLGGDVAKVRRSTVTEEMDAGPVAAPRKTRESDWALKIAKARKAREVAKEARKGKRATFSNRLIP